jgi:hypothetical protein
MDALVTERAPRIWERFRAGSLLDRGPVSLRHREIVIDRTCARCGTARISDELWSAPVSRSHRRTLRPT